MEAMNIRVNGIVQGVGFRPFVAILARELGIDGWVYNDADGVDILAQHRERERITDFIRHLESDAPAAARITSIEQHPVTPQEEVTSFSIRPSQRQAPGTTLVSPDLATCPACLEELFDPTNRRYHYPFINCTDCGPRFTIIEELPYDRESTSMRSFIMCEDCAREYADEADRRYHAQPDACFDCGPHLQWAQSGDKTFQTAWDRTQSDALIQQAVSHLETGDVLAVKGMGGWNLCCDASDESAVQALRERKHRPAKPLAVMVRSLDAARSLCEVSDAQATLLTSRARPIVLLLRRQDALLADGIAKGLPELGIMLPSTPLQHLLLQATARPLVMTSGNRSGEPIIADDKEALHSLSSIADGFLGNDRAIVARYDDSVARVSDDESVQMIRRARGYAPLPLFLPGPDEFLPQTDAIQAPHIPAAQTVTIFAAGSEQKATFCYLRDGRAYVSQHLGDLEHRGAWEAWEQARERYAELFGLKAEVLACDLHPEYLSSKWARNQNMRLIEVQHHHAHIASVMGENALFDPCIGVALDGTGYGTDATIWGCEILLSGRADFERLWHLPTFALPGGTAAIKDPRRTAYALLRAYDLLDDPNFASFLDRLEGREALEEMISKDLNSPQCSSLGRLFDGVSALMGLVETVSYDGEAACLLEAAAHEKKASTRNPSDKTFPFTALAFHRCIIDVIIKQCEQTRADTGISAIALSGGSLVNRILSKGLREGLKQRGFEVYVNRELPPNDGCIAYGQAIVAQARLTEE